MSNHRNSEEWFGEAILNMMTFGMYKVVKNIFLVIRNIHAKTFMVVLRQDIGSNLITSATLFWGMVYFFLVANIELLLWVDTNMATGEVQPHRFSTGIYILHSFLFVLFALVRKWGTQIKLFNKVNKGKGYKPKADSIGNSMLFPLIVRLMVRLNLQHLLDHPTHPQTMWKLNEIRWMKYGEPLLLFMLGSLITAMGFTSYGFFMKCGAIFTGIMTIWAHGEYYAVQEAILDSQILNQKPRREEEEGTHMVGK